MVVQDTSKIRVSDVPDREPGPTSRGTWFWGCAALVESVVRTGWFFPGAQRPAPLDCPGEHAGTQGTGATGPGPEAHPADDPGRPARAGHRDVTGRLLPPPRQEAQA